MLLLLIFPLWGSPQSLPFLPGPCPSSLDLRAQSRSERNARPGLFRQQGAGGRKFPYRNMSRSFGTALKECIKPSVVQDRVKSYIIVIKVWRQLSAKTLLQRAGSRDHTSPETHWAPRQPFPRNWARRALGKSSRSLIQKLHNKVFTRSSRFTVKDLFPVSFFV